jgi:AbrB family looped-hinge helix DNA binding protein
VFIREAAMNAVTISQKFKVVIPKDIREQMHLSPGQKLQVIRYEDRIVMIPERRIADMRGFLRGMDSSFVREGDRV